MTDLWKSDAFVVKSDDGLIRRTSILAVCVFTWWISQYHLRLVAGPYISRVRELFGERYALFWSHLFSHALPVFLTSLVLMVVLVRRGKVPFPQIVGSPRLAIREGVLWGIIACVPVVPLALSMGFRLGFNPNWQGILGNIISNSYEELVYRVFLFLIAAYASRRVSFGILFAGFLFGLVHNQYPVSMQILVGLAGVFFSLAYVRSNAVLAAIIAHQLSDMILDSILVQ